MLEARGIGLDGVAGDIEVVPARHPGRLGRRRDGRRHALLARPTPWPRRGRSGRGNLVAALANAVLAGCGTTPGVGIPPVLISGRLAAQRITGAPDAPRVPAVG